MRRARAVAALAVLFGAAALAYFVVRSRATTTPEGEARETPDAGIADASTTIVPRPRIMRAPRTDPRPDILLFTIDTLRADHVSSWGYERDTMPTVTELASHGTRFERTYATASWTVPSVASIVTGLLPSEHGVMHGFWLNATDVVGQEVLSETLPTIASSLHDAGYRTVGVVANVHMSRLLGFGHGFDSYECLEFFSNIDEVRPIVAAQLDALRDGDTPYFLWVHVIEPHAPYTPRGAVFDAWWPSPLARYPQIDEFVLEEFIDPMLLREGIPLADGHRYAIAAYDSEIRAADDYLHELLLELDDGHLVVMVGADHGEELGDHLRFGHGHTAFEETVRVPLVLSLPDQRTGSVVGTMVSMLDVMPTLLDVAGVDVPASVAGRSLLGSTRGEPLEERPAVIETGRGEEVVRAIVEGTIKYGRRVAPEPVEGLFDLAADPHERHNLVLEQPERAAAMRARLDAVVADAASRRPPTGTVAVEITPQIRAQLRALGYEN